VEVWTELIGSGVSLVTSSLVLVELGNGLARAHHRPLALQIAGSLQSSSRITVVQSDGELESRAWQLFRDCPDKSWGMTDCVSMTLMRDLQIEDVLTNDHHFEQAGFNVLIR